MALSDPEALLPKLGCKECLLEFLSAKENAPALLRDSFISHYFIDAKGSALAWKQIEH